MKTEEERDSRVFSDFQNIRNDVAERIIRGRVLCGEPGDLDYMNNS